jgi:hypothetical protein
MLTQDLKAPVFYRENVFVEDEDPIYSSSHTSQLLQHNPMLSNPHFLKATSSGI